MEILDRLEGAIETLLEQNQALRVKNDYLQQEKIQWQGDRSHLLKEIDRILMRLEHIQLEKS